MKVAGPIDREAEATRTITVRATSEDGSFTTKSFTIAINDLDEFNVTGIIDVDDRVDSVNENAGVGVSVGIRASATDDDATTNVITYSLDEDSNGEFFIESSAGDVKVAGPIDYEAGTTRTITVRAVSEDGSFSTKDFTIDINDLNDNAPIISVGQTFVVSEFASIGDIVGTTTATDADTVGVIQNWAITGGNVDEVFEIDATNPLTECLNRRSFFTCFEEQWARTVEGNLPISGIMVDIDFFKSINDDHGHAVGDDVLRGIAATLRDSVRLGDLVCRYGGEEFCVLLPHTDIETATTIGEKVRVAIAVTKFPHLSVTASLGISSNSLGAKEPHELLDQADKCLYVAKRNGRNLVVRFDQVPEDVEVDKTAISRTRTEDHIIEPEGASQVPYRAVAALLSTLAYRHSETAGHSRRVADLCLMAAKGLLTPKETYTLEIAALLHDIGKIGVPDAILLKNGPLTLTSGRSCGSTIASVSKSCERHSTANPSRRSSKVTELTLAALETGRGCHQAKRFRSEPEFWPSPTLKTR